MLNIFVPLLLKLIDFRSQLPLVFLGVLDLPDSTEGTLSWRELVHRWILHDHIVAILYHVWIWLSACRCPFLHLHHDPLLLNCLWIGSNTSHLGNSLLLDLPFTILHLLDKDLLLQIVWLHLSNELLMG